MKTDSPTAAKARAFLESRGLADLSLYWPTDKPIPQIDYVSGEAQPTLLQLMDAFAESELDAIQRKVVCSFCGTITEYDHTQEHAQLDAILAHIETCEKSPIRQLIDALQEIDKLKAELAATEKRVREECAKAVCMYCRGKELFGLKPRPAEYTPEHRWIHRMIREDLEANCAASPIRSLALKGE